MMARAPYAARGAGWGAAWPPGLHSVFCAVWKGRAGMGDSGSQRGRDRTRRATKGGKRAGRGARGQHAANAWSARLPGVGMGSKAAGARAKRAGERVGRNLRSNSSPSAVA